MHHFLNRVLLRLLRLFSIDYNNIAVLRLTEAKMKSSGTELLYKNRFDYYTYVDGDHYLDYVLEKQFPNDCYDIVSFLDNKDIRWNIVFDVGACRGVISMYCAGRAERVVAFEAYAENIESMRRNLLVNKQLSGHAFPITIVEKAVSDTNGFVQFFESSSYGHGSIKAINDGIGTTIDVPCTTLDYYCESQEIARINLLKIDVEGAEINVLRGAMNLLKAQNIDMIIFEASFTVMQDVEAGKEDLLAIFDLLEACHYEIVDLDGITVGKEIVATVDSHFFRDFVATPLGKVELCESSLTSLNQT